MRLFPSRMTQGARPGPPPCLFKDHKARVFPGLVGEEEEEGWRFEPYHVQLLMSTCWSRQSWLQTEDSPPFAGVMVERTKCVLGFYCAALHITACHLFLRASSPHSAAIWDISMEIFALLS